MIIVNITAWGKDAQFAITLPKWYCTVLYWNSISLISNNSSENVMFERKSVEVMIVAFLNWSFLPYSKSFVHVWNFWLRLDLCEIIFLKNFCFSNVIASEHYQLRCSSVSIFTLHQMWLPTCHIFDILYVFSAIYLWDAKPLCWWLHMDPSIARWNWTRAWLYCWTKNFWWPFKEYSPRAVRLSCVSVYLLLPSRLRYRTRSMYLFDWLQLSFKRAIARIAC